MCCKVQKGCACVVSNEVRAAGIEGGWVGVLCFFWGGERGVGWGWFVSVVSVMAVTLRFFPAEDPSGSLCFVNAQHVVTVRALKTIAAFWAVGCCCVAVG